MTYDPVQISEQFFSLPRQSPTSAVEFGALLLIRECALQESKSNMDKGHRLRVLPIDTEITC